MPRPVRPWFRVYVEMFPDRKLRRLTPAQRWIWVALMGAARESPHPPALYVAADLPMTYREIADYADVKEREIKPAIEAMCKLGMVTVDHGVVSLPNFSGRQFESDNVTERTRAHRKERSNDVPTDDVGTFQRRSREQDSDRRRNTPERARIRTPAPAAETETETETEKNNNPSSEPSRLDVEAVCTHLADRIAENGSKRPTIGTKWRTAARLMIDADRRPLDQIHKAIDWCQADEFWRANILSMPTLREKYDQLRLAALRANRPTDGAHTGQSTADQRVSAGLALAAQLRSEEPSPREIT